MNKKILDDGLRRAYSGRVPEKKGIGFGDSTKKADSRPQAVFFRSYHAVPSMGGGGGDTLGYAGYLLAGSPTSPFAALPFGDGGSLIAQEGGSNA